MAQTGSENTSARIMIVDDNPEFLNGLKLTLEMENYEVIAAADGSKALKILETAVEQRNGVLPDIILTDIMMPGIDGYAFFDRVRANPYTNHIPIIFLTAKDSSDDIQHGKELGSEDYLTKLASTDEILASIRGKLARIEQRRALLQQIASNGSGQPSVKEMSSPIRWNLVILIAVFVVFLAIFGWGLATIMGLI